MKASWRGFFCLALSLLLSFSQITPAFAETVSSNSGSSAETETNDGSQAAAEPELSPQTVSASGLSLTADQAQNGLNAAEDSSVSETARTAVQALAGADLQISALKAWTLSVPVTSHVTAVLETGFAGNLQDAEYRLYQIRDGTAILLADNLSPANAKADFNADGLQTLALAALTPAAVTGSSEGDGSAQADESGISLQADDAGISTQDDDPGVDPQWDGKYAVSVEIREPGSTTFNVHQTMRGSYHDPVTDFIPADLPITKEYDGQLYMLSSWFDDKALTKRAILGPLWGDATFYAAYIPAVEFSVEKHVNSSDTAALNKEYEFTLVGGGDGTRVGEIREVGGKSNTQYVDNLITTIPGESSTLFAVPKNTHVVVTETNYSAEGYTQYHSLNDKFSTDENPNYSSEMKVIQGGETYYFLNSKAPYSEQTLYSYGTIEGTSETIGLGLAEESQNNFF